MQAPPPWKLKGNGYIFLYHFPKYFVEKFGFLADYQANRFDGDFVGTVMLVDYASSAVGSYQELLFIPGRLNFDKKKIFSISKIYVSSQDSVENGIANWGIPKELADFKITKLSEKEEIVEVKPKPTKVSTTKPKDGKPAKAEGNIDEISKEIYAIDKNSGPRKFSYGGNVVTYDTSTQEFRITDSRGPKDAVFKSKAEVVKYLKDGAKPKLGVKSK